MSTRDSTRLQQALDAFEAIHASDPRVVGEGEPPLTHSQRYHSALGRWVRKLADEPSEALLLAAGCQHLRRWSVPRDSYPKGRAGYKRWRTDLLAQHAEEGGAIMRELGYDEVVITRMQALVKKHDLDSDPQMQLFEDAICLSFLEAELLEFAAGQSDRKLGQILRKTWRKMTPQGQAHARGLLSQLPESAAAQLAEALQFAKLA